jgi:hypothetical protein
MGKHQAASGDRADARDCAKTHRRELPPHPIPAPQSLKPTASPPERPPI